MRIKKFRLSVTALALTLCTMGTAWAASGIFSDVPTTHWAYPYVKSCVECGLVSGVGNAKYTPESTLTRAEASQMLYNIYQDRLTGTLADRISVQGAADGAWYDAALRWALAHDLLDGVQTSGSVITGAQPDAVADRKCIAFMLYRAAQAIDVQLPSVQAPVTFTDTAGLDAEYRTAISALQRAGVISGFPSGAYAPYDSLTRAEAATLLSQFSALTETYQTVSPCALPAGLEDFLTQFYLYRDGSNSFGGTYYSAAAAGGSVNILSKLLSNASCVDFSLYPGDQPITHWWDGQTDPWNRYNGSFTQFDASQVSWVARNILHISEGDLNILAAQGENARQFYRLDGRYYAYAEGVGGFTQTPKITQALTDGRRYYLTYDIYQSAASGGKEYTGTRYAVMAREQVDGKPYWTLYVNSTSPLSVLTEPEEEPDAEWSPAYRAFVLDEGYRTAGQSYGAGTVTFALHDMNGDGTPELLIGSGAASSSDMCEYVYTWDGDAVTYAGAIIQTGASYYADPNGAYPGMFGYGGRMERFTGYYYDLKNGKLHRTLVVTDTMVPIQTGGFTYDHAIETADTGLYEALNRSRETDPLRLYTRSEILSLGWEAFAG